MEPFFLSDTVVEAPQAFDDMHRDGAMDGFVAAGRARRPSEVAMGYYDRDILPLYWNVADEYVLVDRFFSSFRGGSVAPEGIQDLETIFDRLEAKGVSWKFYVQNYDPTITYRTIPDFPPTGRRPPFGCARGDTP